MFFPIKYKDKSEITYGFRFLSYDPGGASGYYYHPGEDANKNKGKGANGDLNEPVHTSTFETVVKVVKVPNPSKATGYGNMVVTRSKHCYHKYAHLNAINVSEGQNLKPQEGVGLMGKVGAASSVHLHWELPTFELQEWIVKNVRPDWWQYYPRKKSKAWTQSMYYDPNKLLSMRITIKGDQKPEIYVFGEDGKKYHIYPSQSWEAGKRLGWWDSNFEIRPQAEVDLIPEGEKIILV